MARKSFPLPDFTVVAKENYPGRQMSGSLLRNIPQKMRDKIRSEIWNVTPALWEIL
jgi:hypothetical protein